MSLLGFFQRLAETPGAVKLVESTYAYPVIESVHVWTLAMFVGLSVILDLRLLGIAFRRLPVSEVARYLLPWMAAGFVVMFATGLLLFYAIPVRSYQSIFFRGKVILLALAGLNAWVFHSGIWLRVAEWDREAKPPRGARLAGASSLVLWTLIIFAGRMIAYNWFDCNRQPQPSVVNWAAGCVVDGPVN
jgi:hypothetical protein